MRRLIKVLGSLLISTWMMCGAHAADCTPTPGAIFQNDKTLPTVIFVNGIRNDWEDAVNSSSCLIASLSENGLQTNKYNFTFFWNPTEGTIKDDSEVIFQAKLSDIFLKNSSGDRKSYYELLGTHYNLMAPLASSLGKTQKRVYSISLALKKRIETVLKTSRAILLVPHSQGNFYVESAYAMLLADGNTAAINAIRTVGVAVVAATTPSDRYLTHDYDLVVAGQYSQTHNALLNLSDYRPLPSYATACAIFLSIKSCGSGIEWKLIDDTTHGFEDVYLNPTVTAKVGGKSFPQVIYSLVSQSLAELAPLLASTFSDDFSGASLDLTKWTALGSRIYSLSNGQITFGSNSAITTAGKYTFAGNKIVVEFASPAPIGSHDTYAALIDVATGESIQFGDTNYYGWGLYMLGQGRYNLTGPNLSNGAPTGTQNMQTSGVIYSSYKVFRLTIEGTQVTLERGDSAEALTEKVVRTLGATTIDRVFHLQIGTGDQNYSPGTFDRVSTTAYQLPGNFSVSAMDESTKGYTFTGASTSTCTFNSTGLWGEYLGAGPALALQYDADGIREDGFKSTYPATRVPSANSYSLIVQYRGAWFLAGKIKTLTLDPNEQLFFTINDTPGFFFNNVGQQSVTVSCDPLSISKSLALKN